MAITVTFRSVNVVEGKAHVTVVLDGLPGTPTTQPEEFELAEGFSKNDLRAAVQRRVDQITLARTLTPGTPLDLTPDAPVPDPVRDAFNAWSRDYRRLRTVLALVANGVLTSSETATQVSTLRTSLHAGFLPAYLDQLA